MKGILLGILLAAGGLYAHAQHGVEAAWTEVEKNNTALSAAKKWAEAEKMANSTGLYPTNPEVEYALLQGRPRDIGNRTDIAITQGFDFPSVYVYKSQIADIRNAQADLAYQARRIEIRHQTRKVCLNLIYRNALKHEMTQRHEKARALAEASQRRFEKGDISLPDFNKAKVNQLNALQDLKDVEAETRELLAELAQLNGGIAMDFADSIYPAEKVPADFEQWFAEQKASHPDLQLADLEVAESGKETRLQTALALPKFYAGYGSENVIGEHFQGIRVGISLPLWENRNRVRESKARNQALLCLQTDSRTRVYTELKSWHARALELEKNTQNFRNSLSHLSNRELLEKAYEAGDMSLTDYLLEQAFYFQSTARLLEMELKFHLALTELNKNQ